MKRWTLGILLLVSQSTNAALVNYLSEGNIYGDASDGAVVEIGDYMWSMTYDTITKSFSNEYFDSTFGSGPGDFVGIVGPYDGDFLMAYDLYASGMDVNSPSGAFSFGAYEWFAYVLEGQDPFASLQHSYFYIEFSGLSLGYDRVHTSGGFTAVSESPGESVPEPTPLALLLLGLAGSRLIRSCKR